MTKYITIYIFLQIIFVNYISAQENDDYYVKPENSIPDYQFQLKTNPFVYFWGAIPLTAEYRIVGETMVSKNQSSQIAVSYLGKGVILKILEDSVNGNSKFVVNGFRIQYTHKFFINQIKNNQTFYNPYGLYIGPHISYASAKITSKTGNVYDVYINGIHMNANIFIGYQTLIYNQFPFDVFFGLGIKENKWTENYRNPNQHSVVDMGRMGKYYNSNFKISLGFNIGIGIKKI